MDRALDLSLLVEALGPHPDLDGWSTPEVGPPQAPGTSVPPILPTPLQLQRLLGQVETDLFLNRRRVPGNLLRTAWYLHGVASSDPAQQVYGSVRQRRAFQVSAHVFDLAGMAPARTHDQLVRGFAAQVGYHRSGSEPNAMAVGG